MFLIFFWKLKEVLIAVFWEPKASKWINQV